jgi:hypothetical protein
LNIAIKWLCASIDAEAGAMLPILKKKLQVYSLYTYIYSPERINNTSIIFRNLSLSYPSIWYQPKPVQTLGTAAHTSAPRRPGEVDLHDL